MSSIQNIIVHYHFFKNAGSTLAAALRREFGTRFAQADECRAGGTFSADQLRSLLTEHPTVTAVSSHTLWPPLPVIDGIRFHEILILRHPLDRVRSMYDFYRRSEAGSHPLGEVAKRLDIGSFVRKLMQEHPETINNAQLRMLCGGGRKPQIYDLDHGIAFLKKATVVGTVEAYDESLAVGEYQLSKSFGKIDLSYVAKNVSVRARSLQERLAQLERACGEELYGRLMAWNDLDSELVCAASRELAQRFDRLANGERILRNFRHRVWWRVQVQHCHDRYDWAQDFLRRRKKQFLPSKYAPAQWLR